MARSPKVYTSFAVPRCPYNFIRKEQLYSHFISARKKRTYFFIWSARYFFPTLRNFEIPRQIVVEDSHAIFYLNPSSRSRAVHAARRTDGRTSNVISFQSKRALLWLLETVNPTQVFCILARFWLNFYFLDNRFNSLVSNTSSRTDADCMQTDRQRDWQTDSRT